MFCLLFSIYFLTSLTPSSRQRSFASGTDTAIKSLRLIVTPGRFSGEVFPFRFSFQRLRPISHKARAWSAVVFPELFGQIKTTGLPNSISTLPNLLKFRTVSLVSISQYSLIYTITQKTPPDPYRAGINPAPTNFFRMNVGEGFMPSRQNRFD
jgi:hypothetical protein